MTIFICPLSRVTETIAARAPERIVSLLDPGFTFPEAGTAYVNRHLRLRFHDVHVPAEGQVMPSAKHINELLTFLAAWDAGKPILMHCRAGIGRSTATAFIAACFRNPHAEEQHIAMTLRRVAPLARPNVTFVELADAAMSRNGRMTQAIMAMRNGLPPIEAREGTPFELPSSY